jgi:hypothetical protein
LSLLLTAGANLEQCTPEQVDSFCQLYTKVIVNKGDGQIQAPASVKRRLLVNEKLYRSACPQGA